MAPTDPPSLHDGPAAQYDLFADNAGTALRNAVCDTLLQRDPLATERAVAALHAHDPTDSLIGPSQLLLDLLRQASSTRFADPQQARAERQRLEADITPAAQTVLTTDATPWLAALWSALARRASAIEFDPAMPDVHAAALWLQAGEPELADAAIRRIPSWRQIPTALAWMVQAELQSDALDAAWPLVCELGWLAPKRLGQLLRSTGCRPFADRARRFERGFQGFDDDLADDAWAWFAAWALVDEPRLATAMDGAVPQLPSAPSEAWQVTRALLRLEGAAGRHAERIEHRQRLKGLSEPLFAVYMAQR